MRFIILFVLLIQFCFATSPQYLWLDNGNSVSESIKDIACPIGFERQSTDSTSFANWLRNLPIKNKNEPVRLFDNRIKSNQSAHFRVIDIDIGNKDLQQCADAVIRLRAEYLYQNNNYEDIHFNFTNGDKAKFTDWIKGFRPIIKNNQVSWIRSGNPGSDYFSFKNYLESVYMYAGSYSLKKELNKIDNINNIEIGDIFIQGGFPGHAIIVVDKCVNISDNRIALLLAQSYMPAQDIHIVRNLNNVETNPWYIINKERLLYTPEWTFEWMDLNRFK